MVSHTYDTRGSDFSCFPLSRLSENFVVVVVVSVVVEKDRECYNLLLTLNPLSPLTQQQRCALVHIQSSKKDLLKQVQKEHADTKMDNKIKCVIFLSNIKKIWKR